jgi:membrane-bound metal-dependent hydrolase YbcI (DUF457 family)
MAVGLAVRTALDLAAHAAIPLAEEAAHGFNPLAVVAAIVTTTLIAFLLIAARIKSRRQRWVLVAVLGAGTLSVILYVCALAACRWLGLV